MHEHRSDTLIKVPLVTFGFWVIKILCTTLGETGGDSISMSWLGETTTEAGRFPWNGYLIGTVLFAALLAVLTTAQIRVRRHYPWLYWSTIIASTTAGTTLADFCTRSLGIGYAGGSVLLFTCVLLCLAVWWRRMGSIAVETVREPQAERFYWLTITFSQTLGTALGDWAADGALGYLGGTLVFASALLVLAGLYRWSHLSRSFLFWSAFILTRPLGATVGDFFDKPPAQGGLGFSRPLASLVLALLIVLFVALESRRQNRTMREH